MVVLLINGGPMGLWGVPNNSTILGSAPREAFGVVGALPISRVMSATCPGRL
ncbi:MAG: hypothetical protein Ct9H300mP19_05920 [Dehalococcoidia bacterium]|nr:MAG: hypothetical protein Ct9H300mP19_05920 [Dehalococcoidia bacterium]